MSSNRFSYTALLPEYITHVIGIDEAGRGPLAGPLVVAGVKIARHSSPGRLFRGIRDSKQLSPRMREVWYQRITTHPDITWAVVRISPRKVDAINIAAAANGGARRVFSRLARKGRCFCLLDGSLYLSQNMSYITVIRGDERIALVAAASIIAKVTRDRMMCALHQRFPEYGFDVHKGYGTKRHYITIKHFGISPVHRTTFLRSLRNR